MLSTPTVPIEMKVFQGGGMLEAPKEPVEMTVYKGGSNSTVAHPTKADQETIRLSVGLVVRVVDDSIKEDIQHLTFTGDEQILFDKYLRFNHPFIKKFILSEAVREDFFEFWKIYVNYDGTNKFTLMTKKEGRTIQRFMRKVLDAYREYLMTTVVQFLLKQDNPEELELHLHPPPKETYHLLETVTLPVEEITVPDKESNQESVVTEESNQGSVVTEESNQESTDTEESNQESDYVRDHLRNFIVESFRASGKTRQEKTPEYKIMKVVNKLNSEIKDVKEYQEKIMNAPLITSQSFVPEILPEQIIQYDFNKEKKITEFLRKLVKVNVSKFSSANKQAFLGFFLKIISGTDSKDKFIRKISLKGGKRTTRRLLKLSNSLKSKH